MMTLKQFMIAEDLTQQQMAARIGISRSYLSEIVSGLRRPGRAAIEKIDRATGGAVPVAVWFPNPATGDAA